MTSAIPPTWQPCGSTWLWVGAHEDGFYVEDDGPGRPPEERKKVFEEGCSGSTGGTGLGLGIVRTIVEAHGWSPALRVVARAGVWVGLNGTDVE